MVYDPETAVRTEQTHEQEWNAAPSPRYPVDDDTNPRGIPAVSIDSGGHPVIIGSTVESLKPESSEENSETDESFTNGIPPRPEASRIIEQTPSPLIVLPPPSFGARAVSTPLPPRAHEPELTEDLLENQPQTESESGPDTSGNSDEISLEQDLRQTDVEPTETEHSVRTRDFEATKRKLAIVATSGRNIVGKTTIAVGNYLNSWLTAQKTFASETTEVRARITPEHPSPDLGTIKKVGAYAVYGTKNIGSFGGFTARNTPLAVRRAARFAYMPAAVAGLYWSLFVNQGKSLLDQSIDAGFGAATALSVNAINNRRETNESNSRSIRVLGAAAIAKIVPGRKNRSKSDEVEARDESAPVPIPARIAEMAQLVPDEDIDDILDADDLHELVTSK